MRRPERVAAEFFRDFLPHTLTDMPPYLPDKGSKWQPWTVQQARQYIRQFEDEAQLFVSLSAYLDKELAAGCPPEWNWETWCLVEEQWWLSLHPPGWEDDCEPASQKQLSVFD